MGERRLAASVRVASRVTVVAGLAWLAIGLGIELWRAVDVQERHPPQRASPALWRYGTPSPERLRRFLEAATPYLPPAGQPLAFSSPTRRRGEATMRHLWATYFLPGHQVIPAHRPEATTAHILLSFGERLARPDLEPLLEVAGSGVYRRRESWTER